jgi:hypothetical protein
MKIGLNSRSGDSTQPDQAARLGAVTLLPINTTSPPPDQRLICRSSAGSKSTLQRLRKAVKTSQKNGLNLPFKLAQEFMSH